MRILKIFSLDHSNWGRGKNNDHSDSNKDMNNNPPDLDDIWNDFTKKIYSFFGIKEKKHPRSGFPEFNNRNTGLLLWSFIIFCLFLWIISSFFIVKEGQVSVITRFGKYNRTAQAGFRWRLPYPIEHHELVNLSNLRTFEVGFRGSSQNKILSESLMLTTDENIVDMQFVVQYRLSENGATNYLFKTRDPDDSVRQSAETAMREIVGKKTMDFVLYEGRTLVTLEVQKLMQSILDNYNTGIQITAVAIQNVQPPEQVQAAFDDAVKAGQDRERKINEGYAYANQVIPLASGQASRAIEQAEGYKAKTIGEARGNAARFSSVLREYENAPEITRSRIYLETMESIFSKSNKLMIDVKNNNILLLPLETKNNKDNNSILSGDHSFDYNNFYNSESSKDDEKDVIVNNNDSSSSNSVEKKIRRDRSSY
ncbi:HflK protein [Candidatus Kinetoplastibacterium desouzaii TCC079E]|uniref:Protein HflK n=1 Tax=Candidatus Kinetoplastidibacterium desouzai TCC079E TaxID=1208919 RepID=M1L2G2_9PROT|nr:FtsH protease activity modulator HflK [Candidatus Kinetoplastibacterium desouzaii]AGF46938.1 HflK protein [Candidatus Kinetoplastibacterium desouzaii TCC079E]